MKPTKPISLKQYCHKTPYGNDIHSIIQRVVNHEAELMNPEQVVPLPKFYPKSSLKDSPGLWNLSKGFALSLLP